MVKDTASSKAMDKKEKEAAKESLKAEAEHLELVLDTLLEDSPLRERFETKLQETKAKTRGCRAIELVEAEAFLKQVKADLAPEISDTDVRELLNATKTPVDLQSGSQAP